MNYEWNVVGRLKERGICDMIPDISKVNTSLADGWKQVQIGSWRRYAKQR